jgi:hypothetical protein
VLSTVTTIPYRVNCQKLIGWPVRAVIPMATTLALAATAVPLPPKSAPSAKDHYRGTPCAGLWLVNGTFALAGGTSGPSMARWQAQTVDVRTSFWQ